MCERNPPEKFWVRAKKETKSFLLSLGTESLTWKKSSQETRSRLISGSERSSPSSCIYVFLPVIFMSFHAPTTLLIWTMTLLFTNFVWVNLVSMCLDYFMYELNLWNNQVALICYEYITPFWENKNLIVCEDSFSIILN